MSAAPEGAASSTPLNKRRCTALCRSVAAAGVARGSDPSVKPRRCYRSPSNARGYRDDVAVTSRRLSGGLQSALSHPVNIGSVVSRRCGRCGRCRAADGGDDPAASCDSGSCCICLHGFLKPQRYSATIAATATAELYDNVVNYDSAEDFAQVCCVHCIILHASQKDS